MVDTIDGETINEPLSDWLNIIPHLPPCISAPSVSLPYCQTSASPILAAFHPGPTDNMEQWIAAMEDNGEFRGLRRVGARGHWRPGKRCTMPHAPTQPSTLCKARPSWKRTYFAPRCQFAQNGQIFPGKKESGVVRDWKRRSARQSSAQRVAREYFFWNIFWEYFLGIFSA